MTVYDLLEKDEGMVDHIYFINSIPHIGVGHNCVTGPRLTPAAMRMILKDDVAGFLVKIERDVEGWAKLNDARQAVILSIAFQCGYAGLLGFVKMLQAVALGDFLGAAREIRNSTLAHQNVERTARLAAMMETGQWVPSGGKG